MEPFAAYTGDYVLYWLDLGYKIECRTFHDLTHFERKFPGVSVRHVSDTQTFKTSNGKVWRLGKNHIEEV